MEHDAEYHERVEASTGIPCQNPECLTAENNDSWSPENDEGMREEAARTMERDPVNNDSRFWVLDFNESDHLNHLVKSAKAGELSCIVDEKAGGIVAYVIHAAVTPETVAEALEGADIDASR